jgi:hypothetical protein
VFALHALVSGHHAWVFTSDNQESEALDQQLLMTATQILDFGKSGNIET